MFNTKWVLTNTVRNFVLLVSQTCNQQWQNIAHPIKPAITNDNPQELLKHLQARWTKKPFDLDPYVRLCAKYGRLDCMKTLFEFAKENTPDKKLSVLDALNESVELYHNDCAAYLLTDMGEKGRWQYESLNIALQNHNHEFVRIYLNSLDSSSSCWTTVLIMMEKYQSLPLLCTSQAHRLEQIVPHMDEQQHALCQDFIAHQQSMRISAQLDSPCDRSPIKRKM